MFFNRHGLKATRTLLFSALLSLTVAVGAVDYKEIGWDDLIPPEWRMETLFEGVDLSKMEDDDPRAEEVMKKLRELADLAPVNPAINSNKVRIPGYLVPIEMGADEVFEFLLVPYYGACVHVPPPPINQTIYVKTPEKQPYKGDLFDTIWVEGVITVETVENDIGNAGYSIMASKVELYRE